MLSAHPLKHAGLGYGAWGRYDVEFIERTGRAAIVAISDEDEGNLRAAVERYPDTRVYTDWRQMLAQERDAIDSVSVSTRDHMHAPAVMTALRMGKHVFCQKPLSHQIHEARMLSRAAKDASVVTQMGIQIHSHEAYRTAVAAIRQGGIGRIREVHAWSKESSVHPAILESHESQQPPADLHWDQWLGIASTRPFKPMYLFTWNGWMDFGNGILGNVGCHIFDPIVTALELGPPRHVKARVPEEWACVPSHDHQIWPAWEVIRWEFAPTLHTVDEPFALTWYDGGRMPPKAVCDDEPLPPAGSMWVGERGTMLLPHIGMPVLLPRESHAGTTLPVQAAGDHYQEYVDSCLGGGVTSCGFDYAGPLTEIVLLGMLAVRFPGTTLAWDARACRVVNHESANAYLMRPYRQGWDVPGLTLPNTPHAPAKQEVACE